VEVDYLVVGAGFSGATIAERLTNERDVKVLVIDEHPYVAGSAHDYVDEHGILVSSHGAHLFHTNAQHVVDYLSRFTSWRQFEHRVLASVGGPYVGGQPGTLVPMPINRTTVNRLFDLDLRTEADVEQFFAAERDPLPAHGVTTSEELVCSKVGRRLFDLLYRDYTLKQWGLPASELHASVAGRLPFRTNDDDRYFADAFQAQPAYGYTATVEKMLATVEVHLNTRYADVRNEVKARHTVYTGRMDEFFDFQLGTLPFRTVRFEEENWPIFDLGPVQPVGVINHPSLDAPFTRTIEYRHFMAEEDRPKGWTTLHVEFSEPEGPPHYPVPTYANWVLRQAYKELAKTRPDVTFAGRLGTYKYLTMDGVIAQALKVARNLP
jgi:UDP-galactopyranose mutase